MLWSSVAIFLLKKKKGISENLDGFANIPLFYLEVDYHDLMPLTQSKRQISAAVSSFSECYFSNFLSSFLALKTCVKQAHINIYNKIDPLPTDNSESLLLTCLLFRGQSNFKELLINYYVTFPIWSYLSRGLLAFDLTLCTMGSFLLQESDTYTHLQFHIPYLLSKPLLILALLPLILWLLPPKSHPDMTKN